MTQNDKRSFLFLQGPHGTFFKELGKQIKHHGHAIYRINFNGGDFIDWPFYGGCFAYKHSFEMWPEWIINFVKHNNITDVLLYGDCRPFHKFAIAALKAMDIKIHVFEEGYIRPHWITYELNGVNGYSDIKNQINSILQNKQYRSSPKTAVLKIKHSFSTMLKYTLRHYLFKWLGIWFFHKYKSHRPINSLKEAALWVKRFFFLKLAQTKVTKITDQLFREQQQYFLFLLQLDADYQIREHSNFSSMKEAITKVIYSFVNNAKKSDRLVIKNHPLDNGYYNYSKMIFNLAKELGAKERLIYIDGGNLPPLLDQARGVITINSTAGLQAIHHKKPLFLLGDAIYKHDDLVTCGELNTFWRKQKKPKHNAYLHFRHYLLYENQINGSFYTEQGKKSAIEILLKKMNINT